MNYPLLETLLMEFVDNRAGMQKRSSTSGKQASKEFDGKAICETKMNGAIVGISSYDIQIDPQFQGSYRSGGFGHPDNRFPDEQPELVGYSATVDMFSVLIKPENNKEVIYEVAFTSDASTDSIESAFRMMIDGEAMFYMYTAEDNFKQAEPAPANSERKLLDISKNYVLNNDCYGEEIVSSHVEFMQ